MHQIQLLKKYGLSVRGAQGQHLLIDENIQRKIVEAASPQPGETIIEIGPGLGAITELLLKSGAHVIAIEQDRRFVEILEGEFGKEYKNLNLVHADILKTDLRKYVGKSIINLSSPNALIGDPKSGTMDSRLKHAGMTSERPSLSARNHLRNDNLLKIVGNIPYYITSPILLHLIQYREVIDSATMTIQKEIADRFFAQPGSKAYGRLSLLVRFYTEPERVFEISRNCFSPKPDVDSAVVRLTFRRSLPKNIDEAVLFELIKAGFSKRRKNILNAMSEGLEGKIEKGQIKAMLESTQIDPKSRAEELMLKDFMKLSELMSCALRSRRSE